MSILYISGLPCRVTGRKMPQDVEALGELVRYHYPDQNVISAKPEMETALPGHVQLLSYWIWTHPERGLRKEDLVRITRQVAERFGYKLSRKEMQNVVDCFTLRGWVSRDWFRPTYHLSSDRLEMRQEAIYQCGLRGTLFDKTERIRTRVLYGKSFKRQKLDSISVERFLQEINPDTFAAEFTRSVERMVATQDRLWVAKEARGIKCWKFLRVTTGPSIYNRFPT